MQLRRHGRLTLVLFVAALATIMLAAATAAAAPKAKVKPADTVYINGKVVTVDKKFSIKQAVAVSKGKIVAVGTTKAIKKYVGKKTKVVDLKGKMMLPGINDSHNHTSGLGRVLPPLSLDLYYPAVHSISDIVAMVKARADELDAAGNTTGWIRGRGWNESLLDDVPEGSQTSLNASQLDAVSGEHPVYLGDYSGHASWANSKVLQMAGITKDTPDPVGGRIERNPDGSPTGVFREKATGLVGGVVPPLSLQEQKESLVNGIRHMNKFGVTSIFEGGVGPTSAVMEFYKELASQGALNVRVSIPLSLGDNWADFKKNMDAYLESPVTGFDRLWLQVPAVKIFADGIPPFKTAWMWNEYLDGGYGSLVIKGTSDEDKYNQFVNMVAYAHGLGFQVHTHCTGDRATSAFIDGVALGHKRYPWIKDTRDTIIHGELITAADIQRARKLGMGVNMQPCILALNANLGELLGPQLAAYDWCYRSVLDGGLQLMFSSDSPAGTLNPDWRLGVQSAVLREGMDGKVLGPEQRATRKEAIRAYTIAGAWEDHTEKVKGSIEVGKLADFCVIGGDILTCDAHKIKDIPVLMTIVGDRVVYDAANGIN